VSRARLVFAGTTEFAATILDTLIRRSGHELVAVYTQPDRPAGRGRRLHASPVKLLAQLHAIPLMQPVKLAGPEVHDQFRSLRPDLFIVAAYGLIVPQAMLDVPHFGGLNVHASLLPRWRGAAPIQRALLAGDAATGVTIMRIVAALDAGPIVLQRSLPIDATATGGSLEGNLAEVGAEALLDAITQTLLGCAETREQDPTLVCYAHKIDKADRTLCWAESAVALERRVRALLPRPAAVVTLAGQICKVLAAQMIPGRYSLPGSIVTCSADGIDIATGDGALRITRLQPPGKREMTAAEFLHGHSLPSTAT
jgi:methionyl-tRNA formyltransferase